MLGAEFNLTFEVRPRSMTGLLFHCQSHHGHSLSVFLKKGTVSPWLEIVVGIMGNNYNKIYATFTAKTNKHVRAFFLKCLPLCIIWFYAFRIAFFE